MNRFPEESFDTLEYYVYRLIDPRDNKTFYVGKGKGNRVFAHVSDELKFAENVDDDEFVEDEISAKMQIIRDILKADLEVKHIIHRYGMSEETAYEVESALIDVYADLGQFKGEIAGHDADRGMIDTDELIQNLSATEYDEPNDIDYIIIKTTNRKLNECNGDLYEASRSAWRLSLSRASQIHYVIASIDGIVQEVYEVDDWYRSHKPHRIEFNGHVAPE